MDSKVAGAVVLGGLFLIGLIGIWNQPVDVEKEIKKVDVSTLNDNQIIPVYLKQSENGDFQIETGEVKEIYEKEKNQWKILGKNIKLVNDSIIEVDNETFEVDKHKKGNLVWYSSREGCRILFIDNLTKDIIYLEADKCSFSGSDGNIRIQMWDSNGEQELTLNSHCMLSVMRANLKDNYIEIQRNKKDWISLTDNDRVFKINSHSRTAWYGSIPYGCSWRNEINKIVGNYQVDNLNVELKKGVVEGNLNLVLDKKFWIQANLFDDGITKREFENAQAYIETNQTYVDNFQKELKPYLIQSDGDVNEIHAELMEPVKIKGNISIYAYDDIERNLIAVIVDLISQEPVYTFDDITIEKGNLRLEPKDYKIEDLNKGVGEFIIHNSIKVWKGIDWSGTEWKPTLKGVIQKVGNYYRIVATE